MGSILLETLADLNKAAPVLGQDKREACARIPGVTDWEFIDLTQQGVFE